MDAYRIIAKNTAWLFGGQAVGRIIRASIIIYAARVLGAESWGALSYALSIAAFLTIFADIGINGLLVREGNRHPELRERYLATAALIKLILIGAMAGGTVALLPYISVLEGSRTLIPIILLVFAFDSLRDFVLALARSLERMHIEGVAIVATNGAIAILGFGALTIYGTASSLAWGYALGTGIGLVIAFLPLRSYFAHIRENISLSLIRTIITSAWTFGLIGMMGAIMINTDVLMLGWMTSEYDVGIYSAAQKLTQLLYIFPALIATAFFPQLARLAAGSRHLFISLFKQALRIIYMLAFPLTVGGILASTSIMQFLYGNEYLSANTSFALLALTFIIVFPATLIVNALFALGKQKKLLAYVSIGVFGNIIFNLLLIPRFGIEGSALSTIITQTIINTYAWYALRASTPFTIFGDLKKIALATLGMGAVTATLEAFGIPLLLTIAISAFGYVLLLRLLKEPMLTDALRLLKDRSL